MIPKINTVKLVLAFLPLFYINHLNAQLVLLDAPFNKGTGTTIYSLAVHDNDIFYSVYINDIRDNAIGSEIYISNGNPEDRQVLIDNTQVTVNFNGLQQITRGNVSDNSYKAGKRVFAAVRYWNSNHRVFEFNNSRTDFEVNTVFAPGVAEPNIYHVENSGVITLDTDNRNNPLGIHFLNDNTINNFKFPEWASISSIVKVFFVWKGKFYCPVRFFSNSELHKINGTNDTRITNYRVDSANGTNPRQFLLTDDYIYFVGRYGYYLNVNTPNLQREYNNGICFTNGDRDFGKNITAIYNGTDGTDGYHRYTDALPNSNDIIGIAGSHIIYELASTRSIYSTKNISRLDIPFSIERFYMQFKNQLYLSNRFNTADIYVIEEDANVRTLNLPVFPGTNETHFRTKPVLSTNDKLYFIAKYNINGDIRNILFSDKGDGSDPTLETVMPEGMTISDRDFKEFNGGLLFRANMEDDNKKMVLYSWNVESRSKILQNNQSSRAAFLGNANFKYDGDDYNISVIASTFSQDDQLKVQLLDQSSQFYKSSLKEQLSGSVDGNRISNLFYAVNTLKDGNSHESTIKLSYNEAMFNNMTIIAEDLTVVLLQDGVLTEVTPISFDNTKKEITIENNFSDEAFMFLKINGILSVADPQQLSNETSVFPNPASTSVSISIKNDISIQGVEVFNLIGQKMFSKSVNNQSRLDLSTQTLSRGIYLLKIKAGNTIIAKKLIIE